MWMHDAHKSRGRASAEDVQRPDETEEASRYERSGRVGEVLASATMSTAYRADRAEDLKRPARSSAYRWLSVVLVAVGCACLIAAAVTGETWLLGAAAGVAVLAAALATCA